MWSLRCFCNKKKETKETEPIQQKEITIFLCQIIQEIRNREKLVLVLTQSGIGIGTVIDQYQVPGIGIDQFPENR